MPVRLGEDGDPETGCLENPAENGHGETGVIDISVAGDKDHVGSVPPSLLHFRRGHGKGGLGYPRRWWRESREEASGGAGCVESADRRHGIFVSTRRNNGPRVYRRISWRSTAT